MQCHRVPGIHPTWSSPVDADLVVKARASITALIQGGVDKMKTSDSGVILLLVGGGSIIHMDDLDGVVECIRPPDSGVANAVGAAIAKVSGEIDRIEHLGNRTREEVEIQANAEAIALAVRHGAQPKSINLADFDMIPLQDMTNDVFRIIVKTVGDLSSEKLKLVPSSQSSQTSSPIIKRKILQINGHSKPSRMEEIDIETYIPSISKTTGEWTISETDLGFLADGCSVLGTGGGGTTYYGRLSTIEVLRSMPDCKMRVIDPETLSDDANVACLAWVGAPAVSTERLPSGGELNFSLLSLAKYIQIPKFDGIMSGEIGGWNGFCTFTVSAHTGIPIVDGDLVARAIPEIDMCLPYLHGKAHPWPAVISDARQNVAHVTSAQSNARFERMIRTASVELGSCVGMCMSPLSGKVVKEYCPKRSLSFAWFIGREMALARKRSVHVAEALVAMIPGGALLYTGKVVKITREVKPGWTVGTCILVPADDISMQNPETRPMELQFQVRVLCSYFRVPFCEVKI